MIFFPPLPAFNRMERVGGEGIKCIKKYLKNQPHSKWEFREMDGV